MCGNHESNPGTAARVSWDQKWPLRTLRGPPGPPKGAFWAKTGLLWAPGGQEEAQYQAKVCGNHDSNPFGPICGNWDQIWPPELFSQLGLVLGQKGPLGPLGAKKSPSTRPKCVVTMIPTQSDQFATIGTKSGHKSGLQSFPPS